MAIDGLSLHRMLGELSTLAGGKIDKVQQPDGDSLVLLLHGQTCGRVRLYLNIHNDLGRLQLTPDTYENPAVAPAFCMLLRKKLVGCRILSIRQCSADRIVAVTLSGRDELQDEKQYTLLLELMGRHGNLFLLDEAGMILDCMRHIGLGEGVLRPALPHMRYTLPPEQGKADPFTAEAADFAGITTDKQLMAKFSRLSRQTAALILEEAARSSDPAQEIFALFQALKAHQTHPCVLPQIGVVPFTPAARADALPFPTLSEAFSAYYRERDVRLHMDRLTGKLRNTLDHARSRCLHKLEGFSGDMAGSEQAETYRLYGELLSSFSGTVKKGAASVEAMNWYADPPVPVAIPLKAELDVSGNAAAYFKKYKKAKAARAYAATQVEALGQELGYLEGQLLSLSLCETAAEADEIREELTRLGYIRPENGAKKQKAVCASAPLVFRSSTGIEILVGKNNLQNDRITKNAPENALWLHVKDMPGSHVVVHCRGACDSATLQEAAMLAAYYSKGRTSAQVPVDYLPARHVKKPAGARPGFVTFTGQRTLYVTPKEEIILNMKKGEKTT